MEQYKKLVSDVLQNGIPSDDRTGTGTISVFGKQMRFDLQKGFPLVTLKKTYWKGVVVELLWFLQGETNIAFLKKHGVKIWDEWADDNGELGPVYGVQWRSWLGDLTNDDDMFPDKREEIDQIAQVINDIKSKPESRRHIISAWNVSDINKMQLPPCHCFFQFYVRDGKLSCQLYQRSADLFLGVPFNIASYALLTHLIARECDLEVGEFVHTFGDVHLYNDHIDKAEDMITREPKELPQLKLRTKKGHLLSWINNDVKHMSWDEIKQNIELVGYKHHPAIKADVSV